MAALSGTVIGVCINVILLFSMDDCSAWMICNLAMSQAKTPVPGQWQQQQQSQNYAKLHNIAVGSWLCTFIPRMPPHSQEQHVILPWDRTRACMTCQNQRNPVHGVGWLLLHITNTIVSLVSTGKKSHICSLCVSIWKRQ